MRERECRYLIMEVGTGKVQYSDDPEFADHCRQYPDDYIVWTRVELRPRQRVT